MNNLTKGNKIEIFSNEEFGNIRSILIENEPYFVAKDLSKALGYTTLQRMYDHVDKDDKIKINPQDKQYQGLCENGTSLKLEDNPNVFTLMIINEGGLYSAIFGSELSSAKSFKKWVTSEVLPTIRKTGGFVSNDEVFLNTYFPNVDEESKLLFRGILQQVRTSNEKIKEQQKEIKQKNKNIIQLEEEVEVWENMFGKKDTYDFNELAKIFSNEFPNLPNGKKTGRNNFFQYLRSDGVLRHNNEPYQSFSHHFKLIPHKYGVKTVIKNSGIKWLMKRIKKQY